MSQPFYATKPVALWNKGIHTDFKKLFLHLAIGALRLGSVGWKEALAQALELLGHVELEADDCASLAWLLIHRALTEALFQLAEESVPAHCQSNLSPEELVASLELEQSLEQQPICLDEHFFLHPEQCALLHPLQRSFTRWLQGHGYEALAAQRVSERLPSLFVLALHHQWRIKPEQYHCLQQHIATPFTRAAAREQGWNHYRAWLQKQVDEPLFATPYRLRALYVPLRAALLQGGEDPTQQEEKRASSVDLHTTLMQWIQQAPAQDAVRLLVGEPGAGKSTFVRMLAATLAKEGQIPLLLIPLQLFGPQIDLAQAVREYLAADPCCHTQVSLDEMVEQERLLLILDGLEALSVPQQALLERCRLWLEEIWRTTARLNRRRTRLQVLITGRELLCTVYRDLFDLPGQWLQLCSYAALPPDAGQEPLCADQRPLWWQNYYKTGGKETLAAPLCQTDTFLEALTANPLVQHLLVMAAEQGRVDLQQTENWNPFYREVLGTLYHCHYAGGQQSVLLGWDERRFLERLEEMAVTLWHGQNGSATLSELQQACGVSPTVRQARAFLDHPAEPVWRLLTAFYFGRVPLPGDGEERFTITYQSLAHYLTARRLVRLLQQITTQRKLFQNNPEKGWSESTALRHWLALCAPATMSPPLLQMVWHEIALYPQRTVWEWQKQLALLLGYLMRHGLPWMGWEYTHYRPLEACCHRAETALLAVLNGCARHTERRSPRWLGEEESFACWLNRLRPQRTVQVDAPGVLAWLSYLDLRGVALRLSDLFAADLRYSDLRGADLWGANLGCARLEGADLRGADLLHANLQGAQLQNAQVGRNNKVILLQ
jgi:hypothetical protein